MALKTKSDDILDKLSRKGKVFDSPHSLIDLAKINRHAECLHRETKIKQAKSAEEIRKIVLTA